MECLKVIDLENEQEKDEIEYITTLGGDGTILYASKFFHGSHIPPIVSFSMGSLSYLCYFEYEDF